MNKILLLIIFLEGYVVLASELIAIRILTPFVGNSIEIICIVISAVLIPLSLGYYKGGNFRPKKIKGSYRGVRETLLNNFFLSMFILTLAFTYTFNILFFELIEVLGVNSIVFQTILYVLVFLIYPVYLLGQTIPLITNYASKKYISSLTGKILAFSTIGSFTGSVFSTLVLMAFVGVKITTLINLGIITFVIFLLSKRLINFYSISAIMFLCFAIALNLNFDSKRVKTVSNDHNALIFIAEEEETGDKMLIINHSTSSRHTNDPSREFTYLQYIHKHFINPLKNKDHCPCDVLAIGAGGFSLGKDDTVNNYTFVDINGKLLDIYEEHLLQDKLPKNKEFVKMPARGFLKNIGKKYDFILLDAYTNEISMPPQLLTKEFFESAKNSLKENGILIMNSIESPNFANRYSQNIRNTFANVFNNYSRHVLGEFDAWDNNLNTKKNVLYIFYNSRLSKDIYTDDRNKYFLDK